MSLLLIVRTSSIKLHEEKVKLRKNRKKGENIQDRLIEGKEIFKLVCANSVSQRNENVLILEKAKEVPFH